MSGRKTDVLIEDRFNTDPRTGIEKLSDFVSVFADTGMTDVISKVEGIMTVIARHPTEYWARIDPRYDREFVKREVEAAIVCRGEE